MNGNKHKVLFAIFSSTLFSASVSAITLTPVSNLTPYPPLNDPFSTDVNLVTACAGPGVVANITGSSLATIFRNSEAEPSLAVNPINHNNIIIAYHQDRWSRSGGAAGLSIAYTFDGGVTWTNTKLPSTRCGGGLPGSAGDYERDSDPWVVFSSDGKAYIASLPFSIGENFNESFAISKSVDGGITWTTHTVSIDPTFGERYVYDGSKVVVDPVNPNILYFSGGNYPIKGAGHEDINRDSSGRKNLMVFSKSTDAGVSWSPLASVATFSASKLQAHFQLLALPPSNQLANGKLLGISMLSNGINNPPLPSNNDTVFTIQSLDGGNTWSNPKTIASIVHSSLPLDEPYNVELGGLSFNSPGTGVMPMAMDKQNKAIYATWADARFSGKIAAGAVLIRSADGGNTWSKPINATPTTPANVSSVVYKIAVAANGTVGVLFYDFRNDLPNDSTWDVDVYLGSFKYNNSTQQLNFIGEQRLTSVSMDATQFLTRKTIAAGQPGLFPGDYMGLDTDGNDFLVAFARSNQHFVPPENPPNTTVLKVDSVNHQDIIFTRVTSP